MVDTRHSFVTARGVRQHVAEAGSGSPLVLLHGWPELHPQPTDTVNAASLAEDIVALLDTTNIDRCGFVGHDDGSTVMQVLGVKSPKRVTGLFFFNCATHGVGKLIISIRSGIRRMATRIPPAAISHDIRTLWPKA